MIVVFFGEEESGAPGRGGWAKKASAAFCEAKSNSLTSRQSVKSI